MARVVIVEDEPLYRELLHSVLGRQAGVDVVGVFGDPASALREAVQAGPDVALLDIDLGSTMDGIELGLRLREGLPSLGIVLLSNHIEPRFLSALPAHTAAGWSYLLKKSVSDVESLSRAIAGAAGGAATVDPRVVAALRPRAAGRVGRLTPRQRELLELLAQGLSNTGIAQRMVLAEKSVENSITRLYEELDVDRLDPTVQPRVQAVLTYLRESRLVSP